MTSVGLRPRDPNGKYFPRDVRIARSQAHVRFGTLLADRLEREGRHDDARVVRSDRERYIRDRTFDRRRGRARAKRAA